MMVALAMAAVLSLPAASTAPPPPHAGFALDTEREYVPMVGDSLVSLVGELDGEPTSGAAIDRVLTTLEERLKRTSCRPAEPGDAQSQPRGITCSAPDVESIFFLTTRLCGGRRHQQNTSGAVVAFWMHMPGCSRMRRIPPLRDHAKMKRWTGCCMCSFRSRPGTRS